jgi:hypothetical protein
MLGDVEPLTIRITSSNGQNDPRKSKFKILLLCYSFRWTLGKPALSLVATDTAECRLPTAGAAGRLRYWSPGAEPPFPCSGHSVHPATASIKQINFTSNQSQTLRDAYSCYASNPLYKNR